MSAHQKGAVDKTKEPTVSKTPAAKVEVPKLDAAKTYDIVGTGKNKHLAKGSEHVISGADAMILIENGHATLK